MDNQRESGVDERQSWIERAKKVGMVFFIHEKIQKALISLREQFRDVYESSRLYHACSGSSMKESQPSLSEEGFARLKEFEEKLKSLIEQAETKPPPE